MVVVVGVLALPLCAAFYSLVFRTAIVVLAALMCVTPFPQTPDISFEVFVGSADGSFRPHYSSSRMHRQPTHLLPGK